MQQWMDGWMHGGWMHACMGGGMGAWVGAWILGSMAGRVRQAGWRAEDEGALAAKPGERTALLWTRAVNWAQLKVLDSILVFTTNMEYLSLNPYQKSLVEYLSAQSGLPNTFTLSGHSHFPDQLFKPSSAATMLRQLVEQATWTGGETGIQPPPASCGTKSPALTQKDASGIHAGGFWPRPDSPL